MTFSRLILITTFGAIILGVLLIFGLEKFIVDIFYGINKIPKEYSNYDYYYYEERILLGKKILMIFLSFNSILIYLLFYFDIKKTSTMILLGRVLIFLSFVYFLLHTVNSNAGMLW